MKQTDKLIEDIEFKTRLSKALLDSEKLLSKYMDHVLDKEGSTCVYNLDDSVVDFTPEEIEKLKQIENE